MKIYFNATIKRIAKIPHNSFPTKVVLFDADIYKLILDKIFVLLKQL